jgi:hypothetical protein
VVDMALVFCFNVIIISTAIWAVLRVAEKFTDIALKVQGYEIRRRTDRWDRAHEKEGN